MGILFFLVLFPLAAAIVLLFLKSDSGRDAVVYISSAAIAAGSIVAAVMYLGKETYFDFHSHALNMILMCIEIGLALFIIIVGCKYKKYLVALLAIIQTPLLVWFELTTGKGIEVDKGIYVDNLSVIMILIIGIIGTLICVYATGYMKDFQHHHGGPDRRPWFFFLLFLFLAAMFGLVISNNLTWLYFCWEITSLCSFLLIGFNGLFHKEAEEDKIATRNAFRALAMNLLGGLGFAAAIVLLGKNMECMDLQTIIEYGKEGYGVYPVLMIPVGLMAFAGITKAAQMPFNSWLLGAMVAPTPTSALLHSSTMVKAGVFLIIKLAPCLGMSSYAGVMVMLVGGITFLMASIAAISQSNAKKVLAYSTIANLGLIVACGGIGTDAAVWAGIMLIIFHAVTKSLLFLCVGTAEHRIGSRDIEDMDGLFGRLPRLARCMMIGISAMFLAPMGMLISKWAALEAFVNVGFDGASNIATLLVALILVAAICFGSAVTCFYWIKWLGKLSATVAKQENIEAETHKSESFVHTTLVALVMLACLTFPLISSAAVVPFVGAGVDGIGSGNMWIMAIMMAVLVLLVLFGGFGSTKKRIVPIYMAGVNEGDDLTFVNAMKQPQKSSLRNWYMEKYFGEYRINVIGVISCGIIQLVLICYSITLLIGGAF